MRAPILMTCGCTAQAVQQSTGAPACVIHNCYEVAKTQPALEGRKARCGYNNGDTSGGYKWPNHGPIYGGGECENGGKGCRCEVPSSFALPFFKYQPSSDVDAFYCGCAGWE